MREPCSCSKRRTLHLDMDLSFVVITRFSYIKIFFFISGRCSGLRFALVKICFSFNLINIFGCLFFIRFFFLALSFFFLTQLFSFCLNVLSDRLHAIQMELSHLFRHNFPFEEVHSMCVSSYTWVMSPFCWIGLQFKRNEFHPSDMVFMYVNS